jgi:hypothetical protein
MRRAESEPFLHPIARRLLPEIRQVALRPGISHYPLTKVGVGSMEQRALVPGSRAREVGLYSARSVVGVGVPRSGTRETGVGPGVVNGAGNGIRTRDFDLGKVALYH